MTPKELLEILTQAGKLKVNTRHCYTEGDRKESVADHSWRISLMAMLLTHVEEFRDVDMNRVIRMCLIHDLGESFTGDIPTFDKTEADEKAEEKVYHDWINSFPAETREEWTDLISEMEKLETKEAKVYKALDRLEALISHDESDISTWLPLEYDLQFTYGQENVKDSPFLQALHDEIDEWTRAKITVAKSNL